MIGGRLNYYVVGKRAALCATLQILETRCAAAQLQAGVVESDSNGNGTFHVTRCYLSAAATLCHSGVKAACKGIWGSEQLAKDNSLTGLIRAIKTVSGPIMTIYHAVQCGLSLKNNGSPGTACNSF